jgi:ankyrin repeat protein
MEEEMNDVELQSETRANSTALKPLTEFYCFVCGLITLFLLVMTLLQILAHYSHPLRNAIANGDVDALRRTVAKGGDVNAKDEYGRSMLNSAIKYGTGNFDLMLNHPEVRLQTINSMLQVLLDAGANANVVDDNNNLPLCFAVKYADVNAVRLLIEKGADVNLREGRGHTPLDCAEDAQLQEMISLLKENGARSY